jgi:hypothetical protein
VENVIGSTVQSKKERKKEREKERKKERTRRRKRKRGSRAYLALDLVCDAAILRSVVLEQILGAEIRRHNDDDVGEVDRAALAISQAAIVQQLQQRAENLKHEEKQLFKP